MIKKRTWDKNVFDEDLVSGSCQPPLLNCIQKFRDISRPVAGAALWGNLLYSVSSLAYKICVAKGIPFGDSKFRRLYAPVFVRKSPFLDFAIRRDAEYLFATRIFTEGRSVMRCKENLVCAGIHTEQNPERQIHILRMRRA